MPVNTPVHRKKWRIKGDLKGSIQNFFGRPLVVRLLLAMLRSESLCVNERIVVQNIWTWGLAEGVARAWP